MTQEKAFNSSIETFLKLDTTYQNKVQVIDSDNDSYGIEICELNNETYSKKKNLCSQIFDDNEISDENEINDLYDISDDIEVIDDFKVTDDKVFDDNDINNQYEISDDIEATNDNEINDVDIIELEVTPNKSKNLYSNSDQHNISNFQSVVRIFYDD